jgi:hypothetical protein
LIGDATLACVGNRFDVEWVGDANLRGKEQSVGIYRVVTSGEPASVELAEGRLKA